MVLRFEGRVALITGAGRGLGRRQATQFAEEGGSVIALDVCADAQSTYALSTPDDLSETVRIIERAGGRVVPGIADVGDGDGLRRAVDGGVAELGGLDFVSANAGIVGGFQHVEETPIEEWDRVIRVNLTGAFNTARATVPHLRARGAGAIVFIASVASAQGMGSLGSYVASKHGVIGLMRTLAVELGPENVRVNAVLPTVMRTAMSQGATRTPPNATADPATAAPAPKRSIHLLPVDEVDVGDVTNAALWLFSDEARMVTGAMLPVDAGALLKSASATLH